MLARKINGSWVMWYGERFAIPSHPEWGDEWCPPPNCEIWSDDELNSVGLYRVAIDDVPSGKIATSWMLTDVAGAPHNIPTLANAPPPPVISDRQFFQQLAIEGIITWDEAEAAVGTGTIPAIILNGVNMLPDEAKRPARMLLIGATQFDRNHSLVTTLGALLGKDAAAIDAFWTTASTI